MASLQVVEQEDHTWVWQFIDYFVVQETSQSFSDPDSALEEARIMYPAIQRIALRPLPDVQT